MNVYNNPMKKNKKSLIAFSIIAVIFVLGLLFSTGPGEMQENNEQQETLHAEIIEVLGEQVTEDEIFIQTLELEFIKGSLEGEKIIIDNDESNRVSHRVFEAGDKVVVTHIKGQDIFYIADYVRSTALLWVFMIFILLVLFITGLQGLGALVGMFLSFVIIFKLILPMILNGTDPVLAAIFGAIFIIPLTFYFSHGANRKTTIAVVGTMITLVIAGILATVFADIGNLTGLASEETTFLKLGTAQNINFKGLVLAGMIISILGILDDITIAQAAIVEQLKIANKKMSFGELYRRSMRVGRDHISSMINTLILVYTGASLPLLLLFLDRSQNFMDIINYEFIAEEIIRTFVGSISLILAVPITTLLAAFIVSKSKKTAITT